MTTVLGILEASQELDLLVFVIGSSARLNPELAASATRFIAAYRLARYGGEPPDESLERLARLGG